MVTGHLAVAYAARGRWRSAALPWLLVAAYVPDLVQVGLGNIAGCASCDAASHTLPAVAVIALVTGVVAGLLTRSRVTGLLACLLVFAHLPADLLTGDKPYWQGGPRLGLGLYRFSWLDFIGEAGLVVAAWCYLRRDRHAPRWAVAARTLAILLLIQGVYNGWHSNRRELYERRVGVVRQIHAWFMPAEAGAAAAP